MRKLTLLLTAGAIASLAACDPSYYDENGNLVSGGNGQTATEKTHPVDNRHRFDESSYYDHNKDYPVATPQGAVTQTTTTYGAEGDMSRTTTTTTYYDRAGYYDAMGNFVVAKQGAPRVPHSMWPKRGWCRIWYPGTAAIDQPPIEACDGINTRVPDGAYVIYGG